MLLLCASTLFADEIHLKDGSKIVGTVIGFQDNTYQVQTSFGIVTFPKNMIATIVPSSTTSAPAPPPGTATSSIEPSAKLPQQSAILPAATRSAPAKVDAKPAAKKETPIELKRAPEEKKIAVQPVRAISKTSAESANRPARDPVTPAVVSRPRVEKPDAVVTAAQPASAPKEPASPAIREEVQGNRYINYTYGFRMYKAPSWNLIDDDTRKTLPNAIVALGASDDSTLMVVGIERTKDSIEARAAATEKRLRDIYENYRRVSEQKIRVAGLPAIERRYRGMADGHDWSGIVVTLGRGNDVYTLLGMTYADSDLIQIQENVISRAIASLDFGPK